MTTEDKDKKVENEHAMILHKDPGFWREMWQQIRLVFRLLFDPEVPIYLKIVPFISLVYFVIPVDLLPDFAIGLGQLDDLTVILVGSKLFLELVPPHIVARHLQDIREQDGYLQTAGDTAVADQESVADAIIIDAEHEIVLKEDEV